MSKDKLIPVSELPNNKLGDKIELRVDPTDFRDNISYDFFILDAVENDKYHAKYISSRRLEYYL